MPPPKRAEPVPTAERICRAAETLFAERGIDGVTLLEIAHAAGQKNRSAVQYHFGDRRGLLEAVLERHSGPVQAGWPEPLAMLRREGLLTLERAVGLMVQSLVSRSAVPGGQAYISLCQQMLVHPTLRLIETRVVTAPGALAMGAVIEELAPPPDGLRPLWQQRIVHLLYQSIGDWLRTSIPREEFEADLVRSICGWLRSAA